MYSIKGISNVWNYCRLHSRERQHCKCNTREKPSGLRVLNPLARSIYAPLTAFFVFISISAHATDIAGTARVIDGDTLAIGTQVIRLSGIDAPENGQDCEDKSGKRYNCGAAAENALKALLQARVACTGTDFDGYQRLIAVCSSSGIEINRQMVRTGHALAYRKFSDAYIADEEIAISSRLGVWRGAFENPWDFRAKKWQSADEEAPSPDCPIKGNINRKGERIYHTPWSRSYKRTRINTQKSERWFCTEAEALAAGWRAPFR